MYHTANFKMQLQMALRICPTLEDYLFHEVIHPTTLVRVVGEYLGTDKVEDWAKKDLMYFENTNYIGNNSEYFRIKYLDEQPNDVFFGSFIFSNTIKRSAIKIYTVAINKNKDNATKAFYLSHEVGHLLLHQNFLDQAEPATKKQMNPILESQADFFARLCFWPLYKLFPKTTTRSDADVISILDTHYTDTYKKNKATPPEKNIRRIHCWSFRNQMDIFLPSMLRHIKNVKPI